jgi:UDP-glucuronate 4-epimerase
MTSSTTDQTTAVTPADLTGKRILVTGATGQVAEPLAVALAATSTVYAAARFSNPKAKARLERAGVQCVTVDLEAAAAGGLDAVPDDLDYVLNLAVAKTNDFDRDLAANAEATAFLIERTAGVKAFLHCSSTAVYAPTAHTPRSEGDLLGDSHASFGFMPTYSICKIAAESAAKYAAQRFNVPVTIARLNVPYGERYGWMMFHLMMMKGGHAVPVYSDAPSQYNPIHHDDIVASLGYLLAAATVPATVVNWGGTEVVSIEEWCAYMGSLTGLEAKLAPSDTTLPTVIGDTTKLQALGFTPKVHWRDGVARLVRTIAPDLVQPAPQ